MFEKTFHFCPVGLAHISVDGSFIRVNKRLCDFLGYSDEELTTSDKEPLIVDVQNTAKVKRP